MDSNENKTKVMILTSTYQIKGYIDVLPGARITDFLYGAKDYIAVTDAEVYDHSGSHRHVFNAPFLDVSRSHIEIVTPI